jgi:beta-D-xylosidase 4
MNGLCLAAGDVALGMSVRTASCNASPLQQFFYDSATGYFHLGANNTFCLDAGSSANCSMAPWSTYAYCDPTQSIDVRVDDFVQRLLPDDFQNLLQNSNPGVPRLGLPAIGFSECLHGPLTNCGAPYTDGPYTSTGCPTSFPHALLSSSSFNRTLWTMIGEAVSTEDRALHNQGIAGSIFWAPDM